MVLHSTTLLSGHETPPFFNDAKPDAKVGIKGREKGVMAYPVEEHVTVLKLILLEPNSFNASESLVEWRNLHQEMCKNYYHHVGTAARSSSTLHWHIVGMYG
jgi:hypothetical protein